MKLPIARAAALALLGVACGHSDGSRSDTTVAKSAHDTATTLRDVPYDPTSSRAAPARVSPPARSTKPAAQRTQAAAVPGGEDAIGDPQAIVRDYYAAIRAHDFLRAYRMWQVSGQTGGRSFAQFESGFDSTESVDARVGVPGRVEGAAGSRFVTVPVDVSARLRDGTAQRFTGSYTLRRVEVPGASAAQHKWHLYAANIRQVR